MAKMALLLATDTWDKMRIFQEFLTGAPKAMWRNRLRHRPETLREIRRPINLYFFHRNIIGYRTRCVDILTGNRADWPLDMSPSEFRDDDTPFRVAFVIDQIERVRDTHISEFPMWDDPSARILSGNMALYRVPDILAR